jgi:uncharacterized membrane protein YedE/YeeE
LSGKAWSPYLAGAGLGVIAAVSLAIFGRPLGASGAYQGIAAYAGRVLFPRDVYFSAVMPPRVEWQAILIAGVFLGAMLSSLLARSFRFRWVPDEGFRERFGPSPRARWVVAFVGAFLVEVGAGIAGGCTSGLAVSGGVVLSPGAFTFMAGMFAAGIPTAILVNRGRRARR